MVKWVKSILQALIAAAMVEPALGIVVVEPDNERRGMAIDALQQAGLPVRVYAEADNALEICHGPDSPKIAVMACYDREHAPMFDLLRTHAPDLRAVFCEKPLTEHLKQAETLTPWLDSLELVTMNTVIHFSPVFAKFSALQQLGGLLDGLNLIGAEGAWMGNYTSDNRPLIGVQGDVLHPMGVACDILGIGPVRMMEGQGLYGMLNPDAPQPMTIIHELTDSRWKGTETDLPLRLRSSYSGDLKERRVIGYYKKDNLDIAVEFNFDVICNRQNVDTLDVYCKVYGKKTEKVFSYTGHEADIDLGLAAPDARRDKARAFVGQSLRALFDPETSEHRRYLTGFKNAMEIQIGR